jgi:hypothetical protein
MAKSVTDQLSLTQGEHDALWDMIYRQRNTSGVCQTLYSKLQAANVPWLSRIADAGPSQQKTTAPDKAKTAEKARKREAMFRAHQSLRGV